MIVLIKKNIQWEMVNSFVISHHYLGNVYTRIELESSNIIKEKMINIYFIRKIKNVKS
jgi:hypothetical protein